MLGDFQYLSPSNESLKKRKERERERERKEEEKIAQIEWQKSWAMKSNKAPSEEREKGKSPTRNNQETWAKGNQMKA